ncbi:putative Ulp1 protease family catalytic domain, papain-like cysteine peptidase superfamily [Helianthus annuus]|nr:putative Ulp1 protease family catalytic domain, papain-like cysteine peptidase superfamily [Helianthus annuus]KAJ0515971.1 putative Ulp1 protease family catalytic domain, papain-like cysteine peptidase superfamily [Helianthus annuus]KAJ0683979.1 putative Ulp1 protease family catalytic domain, papain-like cysteine peptidase superfamily [Helianthus annuus]
MQPNSDTMHDSGDIPNDGVADGFEGYATLTPMATQTAATQTARKRRSAIHDGGNVSNTDELQSALVEKFISILDLNNEKLSSIIDAKFEAKLMSLSLHHGRVHSVGKPEVDSFVKFNDVGDNEVATVSLQPCDDLVFNDTEQLVHDAPTAAVRRSERLVKPGPSMLSPFVLFKNVSKRNKNKEDSTCTDKQIQKIRDWYMIERSLVNKTDSRTRKLGKTMAGEVGPQFWSSLLGDDGSGWLSDDHLYGWMIKMYEQRNDTDRWSILPPYFQLTVIQCDAHRRMEGYFNGSLIPIPPISQVDEVYVPLNIKNVHWILGVFHLRNRTLTIYDSLFQCQTLVQDRTEVIYHINFAFDIWLRINGYYSADEPVKLSLPFKVVYPSQVPQQSGSLGDCGVWVCILMERLINKEPISREENTAKAAYQMRQRLAIMFYDSLLPENFDLVSTCQSFENDEDEQLHEKVVDP